MNSSQLLNLIVFIAVFGLFLTIWCICVFLWLGQYLMRVKIIQQRLGIGKESIDSKTLRLWRGVQLNNEAAFAVAKPAFKERLEAFRRDMGWSASLHTIALGVTGAAIFCFILTYILGGGIFVAVGAVIVVFIIFGSYIRRRFLKREILFEKQLLDALGIATKALRAGHPLVGAFQLASNEIGEPLSSVFYKICREQELGIDLKDSIRRVARTTRNAELKLFATAVAIQFQSGGNLADVMDNLSSIIRSRIRLNKRVKVLTAQTQLSKRVLIALPIILFLGLNIINHRYMEPFYTTTTGKYLLVVMIVSVLLGSLIMNRLSVVRF